MNEPLGLGDRVGTCLGYCTNVHAGTTLAEIKRNLERYALPVQTRVSPGNALGIGLWLPAPAARELRIAPQTIEAFSAWLSEHKLHVFTINGFPYGDFHQPVVKHKVYQPTWMQHERVHFTLDLACILAAILPAEVEGSISTLPIAWKSDAKSADARQVAATNLQHVASELAQIESETGRLIHLDLEPEPGCLLERSADVASYFDRWLLDGAMDDVVRRHIRICHDVCHAAVMFEPQRAMFEACDASGVQVGKVQISSALRAPLDDLAEESRTEALAQLATFAEDRYLHQTMMCDGNRTESMLSYDDLPDALIAQADAARAAEWRVHFHVPIHLGAFGLLQGMNREIECCLNYLRGRREVRHFEVETYAWNVLPPYLRPIDLAAGIADEMEWLIDCVRRMDAE